MKELKQNNLYFLIQQSEMREFRFSHLVFYESLNQFKAILKSTKEGPYSFYRRWCTEAELAQLNIPEPKLNHLDLRQDRVNSWEKGFLSISEAFNTVH